MEILKLSTIKPFKFFVEARHGLEINMCAQIEFNVPLNISKYRQIKKIKPIFYSTGTENSFSKKVKKEKNSVESSLTNKL
jgi:hypothetical protein